jgi:hypothetical protein
MAIIAPPRPVDSNLSSFGFAQSSFKIAVNNKAFKILIDKLYSDKIQSIIRELSTNAYDAHIMAGCPLRPFDVTLPTALNPVFTIRDYGVSLTHEMVMSVYVTLFDSSKDDSNEQVGAFGLGSKSPFSYTDSFSVTAYLDGLQRSYIVGYDNDGIPSITHISTKESTAEQGFEVSFPVQTDDVAYFRQAATNVYQYFDVKPNCGIEFPEQDLILGHSNWKLYKRYGYGREGNIVVRQGCVGYPVTDHDVTSKFSGLNARVVIDVPIGSVSVTPSRESISMDADTKKFLSAEADRINKEIVDVITSQFNAAPTLFDAMRIWSETNYIHYGLKLSAYMRPGMKKPIEIDGYMRFTGKERLPDIFEVDGHTLNTVKIFNFGALKNTTLVVDRGQKIPRRKLRLKNFDKHKNLYILENPTNKQLSRLIRWFGLEPHQVLSITSIPDVEVAQKISKAQGATSTPKTGITVCNLDNATSFKPDKDYEVPEKFYWLPIEAADSVIKFRVNTISLKIPKNEFSHSTRRMSDMFGITETPVLLLTKQARNRLDLSDDSRYDLVLSKKIQEASGEVREAWLAYNLINHYGSYAKYVFPEEYNLSERYKSYPHQTNWFKAVFREALYFFGDSLEEIRSKIEEVDEKYILLNTSNIYDPNREQAREAAVIEYIEFVNSKDKGNI